VEGPLFNFSRSKLRSNIYSSTCGSLKFIRTLSAREPIANQRQHFRPMRLPGRSSCDTTPKKFGVVNLVTEQ